MISVLRFHRVTDPLWPVHLRLVSDGLEAHVRVATPSSEGHVWWYAGLRREGATDELASDKGIEDSTAEATRAAKAAAVRLLAGTGGERN